MMSSLILCKEKYLTHVNLMRLFGWKTDEDKENLGKLWESAPHCPTVCFLSVIIKKRVEGLGGHTSQAEGTV